MKMHAILYKNKDRTGKKDATGAFIPEAKALERILQSRGENVVSEGISRMTRLDHALDGLRNVESLSVFCHGWPLGVELLERNQSGAETVARDCEKFGIKFLNLFACSAAQESHPHGCYARWIAESAHSLGHLMQVFGHETAGHTSWNPKARFYWSLSEGVQTERAVDPGCDGWDTWRAFRKRLREDQEYRLTLPFIFDGDGGR